MLQKKDGSRVQLKGVSPKQRVFLLCMQVLRHRAAPGGEQGSQEHEVLPRGRVDHGRRFGQPSGMRHGVSVL